MAKIYSIKHELNTQDNRGTENPFFIIFEKEQIAGDPDLQDCTKEYYVTSDNRIGDRNDVIEYLKDNEIDYPKDLEKMEDYEFDDWIMENEEIDFWHYHEINVFVTACLTLRGAEEYLKENGHNLRKPFIYVMGMYRNGEMKTIRHFLIKHDLQALCYYSDKKEFEDLKLED